MKETLSGYCKEVKLVDFNNLNLSLGNTELEEFTESELESMQNQFSWIKNMSISMKGHTGKILKLFKPNEEISAKVSIRFFDIVSYEGHHGLVLNDAITNPQSYIELNPRTMRKICVLIQSNLQNLDVDIGSLIGYMNEKNLPGPWSESRELREQFEDVYFTHLGKFDDEDYKSLLRISSANELRTKLNEVGEWLISDNRKLEFTRRALKEDSDKYYQNIPSMLTSEYSAQDSLLIFTSIWKWMLPKTEQKQKLADFSKQEI